MILETSQIGFFFVLTTSFINYILHNGIQRFTTKQFCKNEKRAALIIYFSTALFTLQNQVHLL